MKIRPILPFTLPLTIRNQQIAKNLTTIEKNGLKFVNFASLRKFLWIFEKIQRFENGKIYKEMYAVLSKTFKSVTKSTNTKSVQYT